MVRNSHEGDLIKCKDIESYVEEKGIGGTYTFFLYLVAQDITKTMKRDLKHFDSNTQESLRSFLRDYRNTVNYVRNLERVTIDMVESVFYGLLDRIEILREKLTHNRLSRATEDRKVA
jgi:hypothetical protein